MEVGSGKKPGKNNQSVRYEVSADFSWTEQAYRLLQDRQLSGKLFLVDEVISSHVWGACPRCGHALDDRRVHTAVTTRTGRAVNPDATGVSTPVRTVQIDVACGCAHLHAGAPADTTGCGVNFRVELVLPEDAT